MDREKYGIDVARSSSLEDGELYWRVVSIEHLPVGENGMRHHVFVNVYGLEGEELRGSTDVKVFWGWEGQTAAEVSPPVALDKQAPEDMANIPMSWGQHIFVSPTSKDGYGREVVRNLHTAHPDEGEDVKTGHHSFRVKFQLTEYIEGEEGKEKNQIVERLKEKIAILIDDLETIYKELETLQRSL